MNQQKLVKRFRDRVKAYLTSLCSPSQPPQIETKMSLLPIERKSAVRRKRVNFLLNGGLVKLSRKNVVLEEFEAYGSMLRLPPALERHLAARIAKETLALLQGNFTDEVTKTIPFAIKITAKQPSLRPQGNLILARNSLPIRSSEECIDVFVQEVKANQKQSIQHTFKSQKLLAKSHIFVCHQEVSLEELREVFDLVSGRQMMEVERVMLLDKCIATVLYVSPSSDFLHVDSESLIEFLQSELAKVAQNAQTNHIQPILGALLSKGYFSEVASTLSNMIETNRVDKGFQRDFLDQIQEKHPYTADALKKCDIPERTEPQTSIQAGTIVDKTPLFGVRPRNNTFQASQFEESPKRIRRSTNFQTLYKAMGANVQVQRE